MVYIFLFHHESLSKYLSSPNFNSRKPVIIIFMFPESEYLYTCQTIENEHIFYNVYCDPHLAFFLVRDVLKLEFFSL